MAVLAAAIVFLLGSQSTAAAQGTLRCYGMATQIGVVAVREFRDDRGQLEKEVYYVTATGLLNPGSCPEDQLRVHETHVYERDALGRPFVERILDAHDQLSRFGRYEYEGASKTPSRQAWFGPQGDRRLEMRWSPGRIYLYFDEHEKVVGVIGVAPQDVTYALAWGDTVDGWRCGIGFARGTVYLGLQNHSATTLSGSSGDAFELDLRDANGAIVPLLPEAGAIQARMSPRTGPAMPTAAGEVRSQIHDLQFLFGRLAPGRYSVVLRLPHPVSGIMLVSKELEFDIH